MMLLSELLAPWLSFDVPPCMICGLENDSRRVQAGFLFLAYPGAMADGRKFMPQAIAAGATAIAYDPTAFAIEKTLDHIPCIPIKNLSQHIGKIASIFYGDPSSTLDMIGVTGTNGKTTIAYQLAQAYQHLGQTSAYIGTLGEGDVASLKPLSNTTPDGLCLQKILYDYQQRKIQHVCMEVSSHALSLKRVADVHFSQAIYTNLSHEHLDFHHTMENYAAAKAELFAWPDLNIAILNQDDGYVDVMKKNIPMSSQIWTYGIHNRCDVRAKDIELSMIGSAFTVESPWGTHRIKTKTLGLFNVYNSLAVLTSLLAKGILFEALVPLFQDLYAAPGRMQVVAESPGVIVDYAHTPDALENVLSALTQLKTHRLWVVFGCGGERDKAKRPLMGKIASQYADEIILTNDNPRHEDPEEIAREIRQGISSSVSYQMILDRKHAIAYALNNAAVNDLILIAGKGHESYQQIGDEVLAFSDQQIVQAMLNKI